MLALVLESNEELQEVLNSTSMPTFEYFKVKTTDGKYGKRTVKNETIFRKEAPRSN